MHSKSKSSILDVSYEAKEKQQLLETESTHRGKEFNKD